MNTAAEMAKRWPRILARQRLARECRERLARRVKGADMLAAMNEHVRFAIETASGREGVLVGYD